MSLLRYSVKRFLFAVPLIFGVSIIAFVLIHITPGSPAELMAGKYASQDLVNRIRADLNLDEPLYVQYFLWIGDVLAGDFGTSWTVQPGTKISTLMWQRVPLTAELTLLGTIFALLIGLPAGIISAIRQNELVDHGARLAALAGISIPDFWLGIVLILVLSVQLDIAWASGGWISPLEDPVQNLKFMLLPAITLGTAASAIYARLMRSEMLDTIGKDFVMNARLMGIRQREVILRDTVRNALIPVVTIIGLSLAGLMSGAVVIETVFALPGMGTLLIDAIGQQDYPLMQALILFISVLFVAANFLVDIVYAKLDPRITYGGRS
jgi:peptide/nickel transport system permease protein